MTAKIYEIKQNNFATVIDLKSKFKAGDVAIQRQQAKEQERKTVAASENQKPLNSDNGIFY